MTLEILRCYAGIPLYEAASRMGICETALKSACRKLGVKKWVSMKAIGEPCDGDNVDAPCDNALCDAECDDAPCDADGNVSCNNAPCGNANFSPNSFFIE